MTDESLHAEIRRYVRSGAEDAATLRDAKPWVAPHFPRIAAEFYDRIHEHEQAHAVLVDDAQVTRLKGSLVRWLERVFSGPYDEAYFRETAKIGEVHVRVGLPQRYMFTAMSLIRTSLIDVLDREADPEDATRYRRAVSRVLDLELAVMLEAYKNQLLARIGRAQELEQASLGAALRESERRYASVVELLHVLVIGLDREGTIRLLNREAESATGYARDEVIGKPFIDTFVLSEHADEARAALAEIGERVGEERALELPIRTRAGRTRDARWHIARSTFSGPDTADAQSDSDLHVVLIGRDVTDEMALAERTRQAERLAAVGTFAAGLAHEIRNPLNGAHLHVTFLQRALTRSGKDNEALEALSVVEHEISRLSALVTEFLQFARPAPLERGPVSLGQVVARVLRVLSPVAQMRGIALVSDVPPADVIAQADEAKLDQVLLNLARNAIEAIEQPGGRVQIRLRRAPRLAILEIEDDGPGLRNPDAPIFDAFYSTKPGGTGLGLAIVHRIVSDHDGTIDVESHPGRTVFRVALPWRSQGDSEGNR